MRHCQNFQGDTVDLAKEKKQPVNGRPIADIQCMFQCPFPSLVVGPPAVVSPSLLRSQFQAPQFRHDDCMSMPELQMFLNSCKELLSMSSNSTTPDTRITMAAPAIKMPSTSMMMEVVPYLSMNLRTTVMPVAEATIAKKPKLTACHGSINPCRTEVQAVSDTN